MKNHLSRIFSAFLALAVIAALCACGQKENEETTAPEQTTAETYAGPTLEEMSPPSLSTEAPLDLPKTYRAVDKSGFKPIKKENSFWPETEATSVYSSGDAQYFIMSGGVVYVIIRSDEETYYSAYYDAEGRLSFLGAEDKDWFFTTDGAFDYMTYTYTTLSGAQVISFYEGENERFAVYAGMTYYDGDLNELTGEEQVKLVTRVAAAFSMMGGMNGL